MTTRLEDAVIEVRIDRERARSELEEIRAEEERLREERRESRRRRDEREDRGEAETGRRRRRLPRRGLPQSLGAQERVFGLLGAVPLGLGAGFRVAEATERFGADFLRGVAGAIADDLPGPLAVAIEAAVNRATEGLHATIGELRERLEAVDQTSADAIAFARAASLLGLGEVDTEFLERFTTGTYKYDLAQSRMRRLGRREALGMVGENLVDLLRQGGRAQ